MLNTLVNEGKIKGACVVLLLFFNIQALAKSKGPQDTFRLAFPSGGPSFEFGLRLRGQRIPLWPITAGSRGEHILYLRNGSSFQEYTRGRILSISGNISHAMSGVVDFDHTMRRMGIAFDPHADLGAEAVLFEIMKPKSFDVETVVFFTWKFPNRSIEGLTSFSLPYRRSEIYRLNIIVAKDDFERNSATIISVSTDADDPTVGQTFVSFRNTAFLDHRFHAELKAEFNPDWRSLVVTDETEVRVIDAENLVRHLTSPDDLIIRERHPRIFENGEQTTPPIAIVTESIQSLTSNAKQLQSILDHRIGRLREAVAEGGPLEERLKMEYEFRALEDFQRALHRVIYAPPKAEVCDEKLEVPSADEESQ